MYLSKIDLNLQSQLVKKDLGDCYNLHRSIYNCFLSQKDDKPGRIIYRVEDFYHPNMSNEKYFQSVLIVSEKKPDWSKLAENYLLEPHVVNYTDKVKLLKNNNLFNFHLRANPTKKYDAKRLPLKSYEERINWIKRKSEDNGFKIIDVTVNSEQIRASSSKRDHKLTFNSVLYEGLLQISDKDKFIKALFNGIGSGKAFGFGLLTISRYK